MLEKLSIFLSDRLIIILTSRNIAQDAWPYAHRTYVVMRLHSNAFRFDHSMIYYILCTEFNVHIQYSTGIVKIDLLYIS